MAGTIYYGRSFTALRDTAFEWLEQHTANSPETGRFIESNAYQRNEIARAWRDDHSDLRLTVSSLSQFAIELHDQLFSPYPGIQTLDRRRLIEQALVSLSSDTLSSPRQHANSISELFRAVEAEGIDSVTGLETRLAQSECSAEQQTLVTQAYQTYRDLQTTVVHPQVRSNSEKIQAVANADQTLTDAVPHLDAIVLSGVTDPSTVETALIDRLATEFSIAVLLPVPAQTQPTAGVGAAIGDTLSTLTSIGLETTWVSADDTQPLAPVAEQLYQPTTHTISTDHITWHTAPTPDREVRHLARCIRDRLASDPHCQPDDLVVLAPGLLSYRDSIADIFASYDIPHRYHVSVLLERTYAGRAVLDAVALCEQPRSDRVADLVTNPLVEIAGIDAAEVTDIQRRLYTTDIDRFRYELDESREGLDDLLGIIETVQTASPTTIVSEFETLLEELHLDDAIDALDESKSIATGYEQRAFNRVNSILDSVNRICETLSPTAPLTELTTALEGVRVPAPTRASAGVVDIIGLDDILLTEFTELYVLGATQTNLPRRQSRPRYFQQIGEELGLYEPHRQRRRDRYRFGMAVANAATVHITTPETTADDERQLPSPFVTELNAVADVRTTEGLHTERRGSREDLQRDLAGAEPDAIATALSDAQTAGTVDQSFVTAATRGAECGANRGRDSLTEHDGQLSAAARSTLNDRLTELPVSHSRLTTYAKCGFRYMLQTGWEMEDTDEITPGVSSLELGSLIHDTVEAFFRRLQDTDGAHVDLTTWDQKTLEHRLLTAGEDALAESTASFDDVFSQRQLARIFGGLATDADDIQSDLPAAVIDTSTTGLLRQFLEKEQARAADGHRPVHFEASFGDETGVTLPDGQSVPITGIIDRVDRSPDGTATVFDYKFSRDYRVDNREQNARDGIDFQLPMYTLGAPGILQDDADIGVHEVDAHYYILNSEPNVDIRSSLRSQFDEFDFSSITTETFPRWISEAVRGIDNGAFQPTLVDERTAGCSYCAFRDVCDVRHHRRYDVIEQIDTAAHPAYVPRGARPEETRTPLPGGEDDD